MTALSSSLIFILGAVAISLEAGLEARLGAQEPSKPGKRFIIESLPRQVFANSRVLLRLSLSSPEALPVLRWEVSGGLLLWDDLPEVEWRAPSEPGDFVVRVLEEGRGKGTRVSRVLCETKISVMSPETVGMVWIPEGQFTRGDVRGSRNFTETKTIQNACDEPAAFVYLDGYWIDKKPVTHADFVKFLESIVAQDLAQINEIAVMGFFEGAWTPFYYFQSYERLVPYYHDGRNARKPSFLHAISHDSSGFHVKPGWENAAVVDVSWFGAAAYARFHGKSLPGEAQWEKAARGPDDRRYPWGNWLPTSYHAPTSYYAQSDPIPVGRFSPMGDSPYGVSDMLSGNFEWSNDWFNPDYYADYLAASPLRNPTGPFWGRAHGIKGAPYALDFPQASFDESEPVSNRYSWFFEFQLGDAFANRTTTFRTVVVPPHKVSR